MRHSWISIFCPFDDLTNMPSSFSSSSPPFSPVAPDATGSLPSRYFVAMASRNVTLGRTLCGRTKDPGWRRPRMTPCTRSTAYRRGIRRACPRGVVPLHPDPDAVLCLHGTDVSHHRPGAVGGLDAAPDFGAGAPPSCSCSGLPRLGRTLARAFVAGWTEDAGQLLKSYSRRARSCHSALLSRSRARARSAVRRVDDGTPC